MDINSSEGITRNYSSPITTTRTVDYSEDGFTTTTRRPFRGYDFPFDLSSFSVPIAITVILCMVLCLAVFYTKARRRQQRLRSGPRNDLRSISGGTPMSAEAYRNYGVHLGAGDPPGNLPSPTFITDQPPPYEIAISTPTSGGGYAAPLQPYPAHLHILLSPPSYIESVSQSHDQPPSSTIAAHEVQTNRSSVHPILQTPSSEPPPQSNNPRLPHTDSSIEEEDDHRGSHSNNHTKIGDHKDKTLPSENDGAIAAQNLPKLDSSEEPSADDSYRIVSDNNSAQSSSHSGSMVENEGRRNERQPNNDL